MEIHPREGGGGIQGRNSAQGRNPRVHHPPFSVYIPAVRGWVQENGSLLEDAVESFSSFKPIVTVNWEGRECVSDDDDDVLEVEFDIKLQHEEKKGWDKFLTKSSRLHEITSSYRALPLSLPSIHFIFLYSISCQLHSVYWFYDFRLLNWFLLLEAKKKRS